MRILLSLAAVIFLAVLFSSCKKRDYICTCMENHGGTQVQVKYPLGNINDNTAQDECNGRQEYLQNRGIAASCYTIY